MTSQPSTGVRVASRQAARRHPDRPARGHWIWIATVIIILALLPGLWYFGFRRAEDPDAVWQAGEAHLRADRIDLAQAATNRLSQLREPTPLDCMLRAQIDIAQGCDEEAVARLMRVPDEHPIASQAQLLAGQVELRRHRARFAEQHLRKAIQLDPRLVQAHRELIYIMGYQLRRPELNAEFLALSQLTTLTFDNVFHWCLMRTALWEPSTALEELSLFVQVDPEDRWSRLAIANDYRRMGLIDDAETAIAPLPDSDLDALAIRVMLAIDRHQDDKAEPLLASAPSDDPRLAKLRGRLALARRDAPTAVHCFRVAYAHSPEDRESLLGLVSALTMSGDEKSAAPLREIATKFELINSLVQRAAASSERQNPNLLRELGAACAAAGRDPEARAWYRLAIARDPLDIESQQALFQIDNRERSRNATAIHSDERHEG